MSPIGPRHGGVVDRLNRWLSRRLSDRANFRVQGPIALDDASESEPDLSLLRWRTDDDTTEHPRPGHVLLLVEVSESTAEFDLTFKRRLYAEAGIAEHWIFDLNRAVLVVHRRPALGDTSQVEEHRRGESVSPTALPDLSLALDDVFAFLS